MDGEAIYLSVLAERPTLRAPYTSQYRQVRGISIDGKNERLGISTSASHDIPLFQTAVSILGNKIS